MNSYLVLAGTWSSAPDPLHLRKARTDQAVLSVDYGQRASDKVEAVASERVNTRIEII